MSKAAFYTKKPVVVEAFQWKGGDIAILNDRLGHNWGRADAKGVGWDDWDDDDQVVVWSSTLKMWLPVPVGYWIIRGVHGEFYPCAPSIFDLTYTAVP